MNKQRIERTHYFAGEALLTADFVAEQTYNMTMLRNHNRSLHTYGIARGLEVRHDTGVDANQVEISPGTAIDRLGREIIQVGAVVLRISDPQPGANYYLTISYEEAYADYTEDGGVRGYKRIVQQPRISYGLNLNDPGLHLLLAVVSFSSQGAINNLVHKLGSFERRYVGSVLGTVAFVTEGSGVVLEAQTDALAQVSSQGLLVVGRQSELGGYASISARRETTALPGQTRDYLLIDAQRTQFSGLATTRGNLGIGADQPTANLQIDALNFKGTGTLSSSGELVTFSQALQPFFQVGDLLISDPSVLQVSQQRTIVDVHPDQLQVTVDRAFDPPLANTTYTYLRSRLASFSSPDVGCVFEVCADGSLGLGVQYGLQSGQKSGGRGALFIGPDRRVGIGLADGLPQAELDVNGAVRAGSATVAGKVVAGSFEGNGSMLKNLPILSFWTQETPGDPNSKLHYLPNNVGVRTVNSPASLGVGGGRSKIGNGLVTVKPNLSTAVTNEVTLTGYQTQFLKELTVGDTIAVGTIVEMVLTVDAITDDQHLSVVDQPPFVLGNWAFQIQSPGSTASKDGSGFLSSDGRLITGSKQCQFKTELQPGDRIVIKELSSPDDPLYPWTVTAVTSDTEVVLSRPANAPAEFKADRTAFMVTQPLLGQFEADRADTPALLIRTNEVRNSALQTVALPAPKAALNTVGINVPVHKLDASYALQVDGNVNFTGGGGGGGGGGTLTVQTLIATTNIEVQGDGTAPLLLQVAEGSGVPLLGVTKDNVVLGQASGDPQYLLDAKGALHASGDIVCDTKITGNTLAGTNLLLPGSRVNSNGSVQMIGPREGPFTQNDMQGRTTFTRKAQTDGYVMATVGAANAQYTYLSYLEGVTQLGGTQTSYIYAAGVCYPVTVGGGKKGKGGDSKTYYPSVPGSFTMPVRAGETWTLTLSPLADAPPGTGDATVEFYWVPVGTVVGITGAEPGPPPRPIQPIQPTEPTEPTTFTSTSPMHDAMRRALASIDNVPFGIQTQQAAQQVIDERAGDFARILGRATGMSESAADREAFFKDLQGVACKAVPFGQVPDYKVASEKVRSLMETFGRVTGHSFAPGESELLESGIQALLMINDSDANRRDRRLIISNIGYFIDSVALVLGKDFSSRDRKLLKFALARLVGNGSLAMGGSAEAADPGAEPSELAKDFVQRVEQRLGLLLREEGKNSLLVLIDDIAKAKPARASAAAVLGQRIDNAADGLVKDDARRALEAAIDQLLSRLL